MTKSSGDARSPLSASTRTPICSSTLNFRTGSLLYMRPLKIWRNFESHGLRGLRSHLRMAVSRGSIEALRGVAQRYVMCRGHDGSIDSSPGSSVRGLSWLGSEPQSQWHINRLELEEVFLALKDFRAAARTAACTDSHRQHVCDLVHKSPFTPVLCGKQAANLLWADVTSSPSEQRTSPVS